MTPLTHHTPVAASMFITSMVALFSCAPVDSDEGVLHLWPADDFASGTALSVPELHGDDGSITELELDSVNIDDLRSGSRVSVRGERRAGRLAVTSLAPSDADAYTSFLRGPGVSRAALLGDGDNRLFVVMMNFRDTDQREPSPTLVEEVIFSGVPFSLDAHTRENSRGLASLSGDVWPEWLDLDLPQTCSTSVMRSAVAQALEGEVDLDDYDQLVIGAPTDCPWTGVATGSAVIFDAGFVSSDDKVFNRTAQIVGHELGHRFGIHHAQSYMCGDTPFGFNCTTTEYGDYYSIMGNFSSVQPAHHNLPHKLQLGWVTPDEVVTVSTASEHEVAPTSLDGSALPKGLAIDRTPFGYAGTFYVEYRQPIGLDAGMDPFDEIHDTNIYDGALVHYRNSANGKPQLLDASVSSDSPGVWRSAALEVSEPGEVLPPHVFVDPQTGITIRTLEAGPESLRVHVDPDAGQPMFFSEPQHNERVSGTFDVSFGVREDLRPYVSWVSLELARGEDVLWAQRFRPRDIMRAKIDTIALGIVNGMHQLRARAFSSSGVLGSGTITVRVDNNPHITVLSPNAGDQVAGFVPIVAEFEFSYPPSEIQYSYCQFDDCQGTAPCGCETFATFSEVPKEVVWDARELRGMVSLVVAAFDEAGGGADYWVDVEVVEPPQPDLHGEP